MTIPDTTTIVLSVIIFLTIIFIAGYVWTAGKHRAIKDLYSKNDNDTENKE